MAKPTPSQLDPTRTTTLRRVTEEEISRRFARIRRDLVQLVVRDDVFGLKPKNKVAFLANTHWKFHSTPQQLANFQQWLQTKLEVQVLDAGANLNDAYWEEFVERGYKKGAGRAFDDVRKPLLASGKEQSAFMAGTKSEFLRSSFGARESVDKVKLLASRTFSELENVTQDMRTKLGRTLSEGLVQGQNPLTIAKTMTKDLGIAERRAEKIARTEIIRAHSEGQLDAMKKLGVEQVGVMVEWSTAQDDRVCPLCSAVDGIVVKIKEAHGMIPRHPNCRCAFLPANVGESTAEQLRGKSEVDKAIDKSVRREGSKATRKLPIGKQRDKSDWPGADKHITKPRPKPKVEPQDAKKKKKKRVGITKKKPKLVTKPKPIPVKKKVAAKKVPIEPKSTPKVGTKKTPVKEFPKLTPFQKEQARLREISEAKVEAAIARVKARPKKKGIKSTAKDKNMQKLDEQLNTPAVLEEVVIPKKLYHVTSKENVESIKKGGLKPGQVRASEREEQLGVYLTDDISDIIDVQGDILLTESVVLEIDTRKLDLRVDPEFYNRGIAATDIDEIVGYISEANNKEAQIAFYSKLKIPPSTIKFPVVKPKLVTKPKAVIKPKIKKTPVKKQITPQFTEEEVGAIDGYSGSHFNEINTRLRKQKTKFKFMAKEEADLLDEIGNIAVFGQGKSSGLSVAIKRKRWVEYMTHKLDSAIVKGATRSKQTVYRGIGFSGKEKDVLLRLKKGDKFTDPAFLSTSNNRNIPMQFIETKNKKYILEIDVPKGTNAINMNETGAFQQVLVGAEEELLFARNSDLIITGTKQTIIDGHNVRVIKAKVITKPK